MGKAAAHDASLESIMQEVKQFMVKHPNTPEEEIVQYLKEQRGLSNEAILQIKRRFMVGETDAVFFEVRQDKLNETKLEEVAEQERRLAYTRYLYKNLNVATTLRSLLIAVAQNT